MGEKKIHLYILWFIVSVERIGDVCGYEGYPGKDGIWRDVSCSNKNAQIGAGGVCDTQQTDQVPGFGIQTYNLYRCTCKEGWLVINNTCVGPSKSASVSLRPCSISPEY